MEEVRKIRPKRTLFTGMYVNYVGTICLVFSNHVIDFVLGITCFVNDVDKGMMHLMDHEVVSEGLAKLKDSEGVDVQLSYDGLRVPITLS